MFGFLVFVFVPIILTFEAQPNADPAKFRRGLVTVSDGNSLARDNFRNVFLLLFFVLFNTRSFDYMMARIESLEISARID